MKRFLGWIIGLTIAQVSSAQKLRLDKINSDESALTEVKKTLKDVPGGNWSTLRFTNGNEWSKLYNFNNTLITNILAKEKYKRWQIVNLNNDGIPDFLLSGVTDLGQGKTESHVLSFLSSGKDDYVIYDLLPDRDRSFPAYFSVLNAGAKDSVDNVVFSIWRSNPLRPNKEDLPLEKDTLVGWNGMMVVKNETHDNRAISKIQYTIENEQSGEKTELSLNDLLGDKKASFRFLLFDGRDSVIQKGSILPSVYKNIVGLIQYMNFAHLPIELQGLNGAATSKITTKVYYQDNTEKTVVDYTGGDASFSLDALYSYFEDINEQVESVLEARRSNWTPTMMDFN